MKKEIKILKIEPGKSPYVKKIFDEYNACQREVEGPLGHFRFKDGCLAIINDEGKYNGMEPNRRYEDDIICGPFFICGNGGGGNFTSLTDEQIEYYLGLFAEIHQFTGQEPELQPRMTFIAF